jgi:hypothetical protein
LVGAPYQFTTSWSAACISWENFLFLGGHAALPGEKRPTAARPVAALSLTTTKEWRPTWRWLKPLGEMMAAQARTGGAQQKWR